jgi:hypothetical protein
MLPTMTSKSQSLDVTQVESDGRRTTVPVKDHHQPGVPDTAFTIGARVLVGGQKPGRLRYIGSVHFVPDSAGLWCGIELDDPDGLHDGTVDGVRYFTCRDGHGILAPRHRVTVYHQPPASASTRNPWSSCGDEMAPPIGPAGLLQQRQQRNSTGIPSPVQLRRKNIEHTAQATSSNAFSVASLTDAATASVSCPSNPDARRSIPEFRVRPSHSPTPFGSISGTTTTGCFGGGIAGGGGQQIRPMSASMIDSDVVMRIGSHQREQMTHSSIGALASPKRSNLIGNRPLSAVVQTANIRSSPKRVTFFDEVGTRPHTDPGVDAGGLQHVADRHGFLNPTGAGRKPEVDNRSTTKRSSAVVENPVSLLSMRRSHSADGREAAQTMTSRARDHHRSSRTGDEILMSKHQTIRTTVSPEILTVDEYELTLHATKSKPIPDRNAPSSDTEQQIDTAIADMLTPPDTEMQISADSIDLSDQLSSSPTNSPRRQRTGNDSLSTADHRKLSLDSTLAEFYSNFPTDARPTSRAATGGGRTSGSTRSASDERRQSEASVVSSMPSWSSSLDHDCGSSRSAAGLELARTALAQYADLVRAAQQCRLGYSAASQAANRRPFQPHPHTGSTSVDLPPPAGSDNDRSMVVAAAPVLVIRSFDATEEPMLVPHQQLSMSHKTRRSPAEATWDSWTSSGGSSSNCIGGGEEMEFETFDGEELLLDAAMIDSIDGASVHSEDSMAMVPHLSDDDDDVDDIAAVSFPDVQEAVDIDDDRLRSSVYEDDSLNVSVDLDVGWPSSSSDIPLDRGVAAIQKTGMSSLDKEGNVNIGILSTATSSTAEKTGSDVGWLNDINDVISRQLRQPWTLMVTADVESGDKHEDQLRPVTANDDVMYDSYGRIIRPMSLISNSSSVDTGE